MCVISKCTEALVEYSKHMTLALLGTLYYFLKIYKLITTLIMSFLTYWQSLVTKTHRYHKKGIQQTL